MLFKDQTCVVTGGAGFIGHHIVNRLLKEGAKVIIIDNLLTGRHGNVNVDATFYNADVTDRQRMRTLLIGADYVFHTAALARTPWTVDDPIFSHELNASGTLNVLEAARENKVKRLVHSSSCILYVPNTPYYVSKLCAEEYVKIYPSLYNFSCIALRYSNVYGAGQNEDGPYPNVFASLRKSYNDTGRIWITGDGEQTRDYVHVSDVVEANVKAALSDYCGVLDVCTGINTSLNEVAKYFKCPVDYVDERKGDQKHIRSDPKTAQDILGFTAKIKLSEGIQDALPKAQAVV